MADNNATPPKPSAPLYSAGHVPITEEFDSAKRTLPPVLPVVVALALVALVVGVVVYSSRAKPAAQGGIDDVHFSQPANMTSPMILMDVTLRNVSDKTLYIKDIKATIKTDQGNQSDDAASVSDFDRYLQAYPDLSGHERPLMVEMKIAPGAMQKGSVMVSLPITKEQFDARKDLVVTIEPYDQAPVVLHEKTATPK
jgi:hypothetical protein